MIIMLFMIKVYFSVHNNNNKIQYNIQWNNSTFSNSRVRSRFFSGFRRIIT